MASKIHVLPTDNNNKDVVADVPDEVFDIYTTSKMYQAMKPLFMTLRIFGLTYVRSFGPVNQCNEKVRCHNTGEEYTGEKHGKGKCSASQIYAWTVCVSMYLMGLRVVTVFSYGEFILGPDLFYKLTTFTWTCLLLANLTMFMLASHRYTGIPKFFIEFVDSPCSTCPSKVRKVAWITMGVSWMLMAFCAAVILYAVIWDPVLIYPLLAPFQLGDDGTLVIRILLVIFGPLMCALWMCPVSMDVIFCYTLYRAFTHWNLKFKSKVCGMTTETFIKERRHHQKICRLVAEADDFLSIHKAWSLVFNVAIILFILYTLLYASDEMRTTAFYVANLTWFTLIWVNLITTCISGILVNDAAHAVFDDIQEITTDVDLMQLELFQSRLSGSRIGISALGCFVIDKPAVIGMMGMLLTYFIVIIQFAPTSSTTADTCNCSDILSNASLYCAVMK